MGRRVLCGKTLLEKVQIVTTTRTVRETLFRDVTRSPDFVFVHGDLDFGHQVLRQKVRRGMVRRNHDY